MYEEMPRMERVYKKYHRLFSRKGWLGFLSHLQQLISQYCFCKKLELPQGFLLLLDEDDY